MGKDAINAQLDSCPGDIGLFRYLGAIDVSYESEAGMSDDEIATLVQGQELTLNMGFVNEIKAMLEEEEEAFKKPMEAFAQKMKEVMPMP